MTTLTTPLVTRISGPTVTASGMAGAQMYEVVQVGELGLVGEVVRLIGDHATIQVYEDTTMLKPGAPVRCTGAPLSVWLGPGLIGNIYDGIQRPLPGIQIRSGAWIRRGEKVEPLDAAKPWHFTPLVKAGDRVVAGQAIGEIAETKLVQHLVMAAAGCERHGAFHRVGGRVYPAGNPGRRRNGVRRARNFHAAAMAGAGAAPHPRAAAHRRTAHHRPAHH